MLGFYYLLLSPRFLLFGFTFFFQRMKEKRKMYPSPCYFFFFSCLFVFPFQKIKKSWKYDQIWFLLNICVCIAIVVLVRCWRIVQNVSKFNLYSHFIFNIAGSVSTTFPSTPMAVHLPSTCHLSVSSILASTHLLFTISFF